MVEAVAKPGEDKILEPTANQVIKARQDLQAILKAKAESKPSYRAGAGDPGKSWRKDGAGKPGGKRSGPKGPPPPKGKASSKKNRARVAEAKAAKGGGAKPRRPKS